MKRADLLAMDHAALIRLALDHDVPDAYRKGRAELASGVLIRRGERAEEEGLAPPGRRLERLEEEMRALQGRMGRALQRVERLATEARGLAEMSLMTATARRAPTPDEVSAMSDAALRHLTEQLGLATGPETSKAALLDSVARKLRWDGWRGADERRHAWESPQ